jgi:hypothetical protein
MTQGKGISIPDWLPQAQPVGLRVLGASEWFPLWREHSAPGVTLLTVTLVLWLTAADCRLGVLECETYLPVNPAHFRITMESTPLSCLWGCFQKTLPEEGSPALECWQCYAINWGPGLNTKERQSWEQPWPLCASSRQTQHDLLVASHPCRGRGPSSQSPSKPF